MSTVNPRGAGTGEILLFGWDGGGNVPPLIALGKHLGARGHHVRMVGTETMAERAAAAGIEFAAFSRVPSWAPRPGHALEDEMDSLANHLLGPELGEELLTATGRSLPHALVVDCMAAGALSVAEHLALPTTVLVHLRARFHHDARGGSSPASKAAKEALNRQRMQLGLDALPVEPSWWGQLWQRAGRVRIASLPELEGPGDPLPSSFEYVGAVLDPCPDELPTEASQLVRGDGEGVPVVVTSLSTTYMHQESQLDAVVSALDGLRGVVTVGSGLEPDAVRSKHGVLVCRWLSHERLLPHADVVVTHAGHGTVMSALAAGVPLVCMPMGRDQHGNAEQVERAGAGVCVEPEVDAEQLRAAIDTVLSDRSYRSNAARLAESARQLGGGARLADELEARIHLRAPATSVPTRRKG